MGNTRLLSAAFVAFWVFGTVLATGCASTPERRRKPAWAAENRPTVKQRRRTQRRLQRKMTPRQEKRLEAQLIRRGNRVRYAPALDSW